MPPLSSEREALSHDKLQDEEPSPLPIGPDGAPTLAQPVLLDKIPEATVDTLICLRGPCKHYVQLTTMADVVQGIADHTLKQIERFCAVIQGDAIDLTDQCVFDCSHWHPEDERLIAARDLARKRWESTRGD